MSDSGSSALNSFSLPRMDSTSQGLHGSPLLLDQPPPPQEIEGGDTSTTSTSATSPSLSSTLYYSLRHLLHQMTSNENVTCLSNCSGRGECLEGTCHCQVQYHGDSCTDPNVLYFASFATIFYLIACVSLCQLVILMRSEYSRMKTPTLAACFKITTQKALYVNTFIASTLRGAYFSSPSHAELRLSSSFMSSFYPMILISGSLIVCFWAENFHLRDIRCEQPRFLGKSFCGFIAFNIVTYSLFLAEVILMQESDTQEEKSFFAHIFNGCYALLMFVMVVFFLIYGVEVYFKVRGGFVGDTVFVEHVHSRQRKKVSLTTEDEKSNDDTQVDSLLNRDGENTDEKQDLVESEPVEDGESERLRGACTATASQRGVNWSQLRQSRFGLVFQASMLMITVCFLCSDVLGGFWKIRFL